MSDTQTLAMGFFLACVVWNCYESYRMRRHRRHSDLMGSLITSVLQKMEMRQDALIANDRTISRTLEAIERRISCPNEEK
jgi:hypothetical protein